MRRVLTRTLDLATEYRAGLLASERGLWVAAAASASLFVLYVPRPVAAIILLLALAGLIRARPSSAGPAVRIFLAHLFAVSALCLAAAPLLSRA